MGRLLRLVAEGVGDGGCVHALLLGYGGPGVARGVGGEAHGQPGEPRYALEGVVGAPQRALVLQARVGRAIGDDGEHEGRRVGGVLLDQGADVGIDADGHGLVGLLAAVDYLAAADVGAPQVGGVDKAHASRVK